MEMAATEGEQIQFSGHTLDKAIKAKVHLENYYSNLIAQHIERKTRLVLCSYCYSFWHVILLVMLKKNSFKCLHVILNFIQIYISIR